MVIHLSFKRLTPQLMAGMFGEEMVKWKPKHCILMFGLKSSIGLARKEIFIDSEDNDTVIHQAIMVTKLLRAAVDCISL